MHPDRLLKSKKSRMSRGRKILFAKYAIFDLCLVNIYVKRHGIELKILV